MSEKQAVIRIRLQPGARKDEFCEWMADGVLKVRVKSKPIEGKANRNLLRFLSRKLKISSGNLEIKTGAKSRNKLIVIRGIEQADLQKRIDAYINQEP